MKYFFIFFLLYFCFPSAAAEACKEAASAAGIDRQALRADVLRRARIEFEDALQEIRMTPQEPRFQEEGFKDEYYRGLDKAREFNEVKKWLQKIKADPKHIHIPYFADQAEKTIADFERYFKLNNRQSISFLRGRLKLLEALKRETRKRMEDQNASYNWWASFNLRLLLIASEPAFVQKFLKAVNISKIENIYNNPEGVQELFLDAVGSISPGDVHDDIAPAIIGLKIFISKKEYFPDEIMFFTTGRLGVMAFNSLEAGSYFLGVIRSPQTADGRRMDAFSFFSHDIGHAAYVNTNIQGVLERIGNISSTSDREKAELALFMYRHENGSSEIRRELEDYYISEKINASPAALRRRKDDVKKAVRNMMKNKRRRFFDPNDLQKLLPENVNAADSREVERFLTESADLFTDILLAR